jgi:transcriptional regulator with XRE-family HTH domain
MVKHMTFGEKLKELRTRANLSQPELAKAIGTTTRSVQNYEYGRCYPKQTEIYAKISEKFGVTVDYLMSPQDSFLAKAYEDGGSKGKRTAESLVTDATALFAGGTLSEDDKDAVFRSLQEAYWLAKTENKKYAAKRKRHLIEGNGVADIWSKDGN